MDALTRILAPEIEKRVNTSIMEIVGRMIKSGSDNGYISYITNVPENEIESLRSSMTV